MGGKKSSWKTNSVKRPSSPLFWMQFFFFSFFFYQKNAGMTGSLGLHALLTCFSMLLYALKRDCKLLMKGWGTGLGKLSNALLSAFEIRSILKFPFHQNVILALHTTQSFSYAVCVKCIYCRMQVFLPLPISFLLRLCMTSPSVTKGRKLRPISLSGLKGIDSSFLLMTAEIDWVPFRTNGAFALMDSFVA